MRRVRSDLKKGDEKRRKMEVSGRAEPAEPDSEEGEEGGTTATATATTATTTTEKNKRGTRIRGEPNRD